LWEVGRPKKDEVTGEWRKLHNEELYYLVDIVLVTKSRRIGWGRCKGKTS
jgi:hypothetical protein